MSITIVGPWVLLILGAVLTIAAAAVAVWRKPPQGLLQLLIFGALFAGLSIWGLKFLDPYGKLLQTVVNAPSLESYSEAFDAIAKGDVPEGYEQAILAYTLEHPVDGMDDALKAAAERATPDAKKTLRATSKTLVQKQEAARQLTESLSPQAQPISPDALLRLDTATRNYIVMDPTAMRRIETTLDAAQLERFRRQLQMDSGPQ